MSRTQILARATFGALIVLLSACGDAPAPTAVLQRAPGDAAIAGAWTTRGSLNVRRTQMTAAAINGKIYVAAGGQGFPSFLRSTEIYNPATNSWTFGANASTPRVFISTNSGAINGVLYAVAGNPIGFCTTQLEAYTVATNTWAGRPGAPRERCGAASFEHNGKLWVLGGVNTSSTVRPVEIDVYDPATNSWSTPMSMPAYRAGFGAAILNGKLYLVGGDVSPPGTCTNGVDVFDFATSSWSSVAPMSQIRCQAGVAALDGRLYVVGGYRYDGTIYSSVESFDPVTNSWRAEPSLSGPRYSPAVVVLDGTLYSIGGWNGASAVATVEALVPLPSNIAPVANAGASRTLECTDGAATTTLDGSASTDADGTIASWLWSGNSGTLATTMIANVAFPLGTHPVTLTVTDDDGATDDASMTVSVVDTRAPGVVIVPTGNALWPPNHRMVHVATVSASDQCDGAAAASVTVTSSEAVNGTGDGNTNPDWELRSNADGSVSVFVRAERTGAGAGRTYTIGAISTDHAGNASHATMTASVPSDKRK